MEWQAVVLAVQILILAVGWVLFQKAKAELSVKAAETPVLGELRTLKSQIKQLLDEIETAGDTASAQMETKCRNAYALLQELEAQTSETEETLHSLMTLPRQEIRTESFAPMAITSVSPLLEESPKRAPRRTKSAMDMSTAAPAVTTKAPPRKAKLTATPAVAEAVALVGMAARRQQIYALADQGKPMTTIARETDISVAEVETLIGLRGR